MKFKFAAKLDSVASLKKFKKIFVKISFTQISIKTFNLKLH